MAAQCLPGCAQVMEAGDRHQVGSSLQVHSWRGSHGSGGLGWTLALEQPQRPGLAADVVPGLQRGWVWRKQEGTRGWSQ